MPEKIPNIQMVDLEGQYLAIKNELDAAMAEVIRTTAFINGPVVRRFEDKLANYLNVRHVIACANGTDALQIALMALELQPGDEVIVPDFTFIAPVEAVALLGLKPILADIDPQTFNISVKSIEAAISKRTRAILPVHLFGQSAEMEAIMALAKQHNLYVIEDTAQAIGTDCIYSDGQRQKAGTTGDIGCTSFFPSKTLGAYGDGGALFTNNENLAERCRMIARHGAKEKYFHTHIGINSRLDSLQAAVLEVKLRYLDQYIASRQAVAAYYDRSFADIPALTKPYRAKYSTHTFHQYTLCHSNRDALKAFLKQHHIPAMIYYPVPVHHQKAYRVSEDFSVSEQASQEVLSLPIHTELTEETCEYIAHYIEKFIETCS